jgi:16S rRNA (guanine1207-N2)-methyltransferase
VAEHYFSSSPAVASDPKTVRLSIAGSELLLETDTGIFSHDRVDPGTEVLLRVIPSPPPSGTLLDLGCGYGPIAIYVALQAPGSRVHAIDINERAVEVTTRNALTAGASNVIASIPAAIDETATFEAIYCNPPIRVGKAALHEMLDQWLNRLAPAGTAYLVVQKHLGADSLAAWLREQGFQVERIASKRAYRVLAVSRT